MFHAILNLRPSYDECLSTFLTLFFDFILIEGNEMTNFRTKISAERIVIQYLCDFLDIYKYYACTIEHFSEKEKYRYFNLNSNNQMRTYLLCLMQLQCI